MMGVANIVFERFFEDHLDKTMNNRMHVRDLLERLIVPQQRQLIGTGDQRRYVEPNDLAIRNI